ncbi:MAG: hypothetical protein ACRCZI_05150, partial [Cetobacterium sp.]
MNLEELMQLKKEGLITEETFEVLSQDLRGGGVENEGLYSLSINSILVSRTYKILSQDGKRYFSLKEFFKFINFTNYKEKGDILTVYLGSALREEKINLKQDAIKQDDDIFLSEDKFKEIFLRDFTIERKGYDARMYLSFDTPNEIRQLLDINKSKINRDNKEQELIYKSERKLFDLGYTRVQLGQSLDKSASSKKYDSEWDGTLSYQGGLLYGEVKADYDMKENELNTVRLEY